MGFWASTVGPVTGEAKDAFLPDFTAIPEGSTALATIKSFTTVDAPATKYKAAERYLEVIYKLIAGDFKGREVSQKIRVFDGKPEAIHRSLNMLRLVMTLCSYKPTHDGEPTNAELAAMCGKVVGIKIGEWAMPKEDGGMLTGNHVREVHPSANFKCETGVKAEVTHSRASVDSAFSRNPKVDDLGLDSDLPF